MKHSDAAAVRAGRPRSRAHAALRRRTNWVQLARFCVVGASGYAVNLAVFALLVYGALQHYRVAATASFLVAASWNYTLNRVWTFRRERGHIGLQGLRFLIVSALVYGGNLLLLTLFVEQGVSKLLGQAIAIVLVTPLNFLGNKLWSFRR